MANQNDQNITELPIKTNTGISLSDYLLGIDSAEGYQMLISDIAKKIVEDYAGSRLLGRTQSLQSVINSMKVGGRNLLSTRAFRIVAGAPDVIDYAEGWVSDSTPTADSRPWSYANSSWQIENLPAGTYTLSWEVGTALSNSETGTHIRVYNSSGTQLLYSENQFGSVGKFSAQFTLTETTTIGIVFKIFSAVARFKLESGTMATDWVPAPEDIRTELNSKTTVEEITATRVQDSTGGSCYVSKIGKICIATLSLKTNASLAANTVIFSDLPNASRNGFISVLDSVGNYNLLNIKTDGTIVLVNARSSIGWLYTISAYCEA